MSEFEHDIVIGEELENPLAAKLREFALQNREDVTIRAVFSNELESQDIFKNPRKFIDDAALQWLNVRIYKVKREEALDKPRSWMKSLDSVFVKTDDRDKLIERLFQKVGLLSGKVNNSLREYGYGIFTESVHPLRNYLRTLPGQWKLGVEAYVALDIICDLYGYDSNKLEGLGLLLCKIDENPNFKDIKGHLKIRALMEVLNNWYRQRKPISPE